MPSLSPMGNKCLILVSLLFLRSALPTYAARADAPDALNRWVANTERLFPQWCSAGIERKVVTEVKRQPKVVTVRLDGKGDFKTVTDAVNSIPEGNTQRTVVKIGPSVYWEKVTVDRSKRYVTFLGEPDAMSTISFDGTAARFGTLESATVAVESDHFVASNIIFENSAPKPSMGVAGAQAVAMRISGDKAAFYNCRFYGYQDTLCDDKGMHFFKECYIRGMVDFIFGNGRSIYLDCMIESVADGKTWITAQARESSSDTTGFSFLHCNITGSGNVYLSRAWKQSSRVVFAYTYMSNIVNPEGWDDNDIANRQESVFYGEYECTGPGATTEGRVSYAKKLTKEQAEPFLSMTFINARKWLLPPPKI